MTIVKVFAKKNTPIPRIKMSTKHDHPVKSKDVALQDLVYNAAKCIAPVWPLETFIACNPLLGFESQPFDEALVQNVLGAERTESNLPLEEVNRQMIKPKKRI